MTQTKTKISTNHAAEIISLGFTIKPAQDRLFIDEHCTSYAVHPFREFDITIGKYLEDGGREGQDHTFSRFTITYNPQNQSQIAAASKLRRGLQEYGITFNETPNRGELVGELEGMLGELKK